jgi:hypothetical protein
MVVGGLTIGSFLLAIYFYVQTTAQADENALLESEHRTELDEQAQAHREELAGLESEHREELAAKEEQLQRALSETETDLIRQLDEAERERDLAQDEAEKLRDELSQTETLQQLLQVTRRLVAESSIASARQRLELCAALADVYSIAQDPEEGSQETAPDLKPPDLSLTLPNLSDVAAMIVDAEITLPDDLDDAVEQLEEVHSRLDRCNSVILDILAPIG